MNINTVLFFIFSSIAVITSVLVITRKNPVISALFLVLNFASLAGIYLLLAAQFIAVVQIIVYAGAIMVLFLFVIMLLKPEHEKGFFEDKPLLKYLAVGTGVIVFLQLVFIIIAGSGSLKITPTDYNKSIEIGTIETIGKELFTTYLLPFESIAFVLLAAAIGALMLSKKKLES